jgi:ribosomal protein S12 methylthiotransferase accessory factor
MQRLSPFLQTAGITRLANITGLDRIGVPVTLAIRPAARSLVGSAGKGFTLDAASVSAAMEAIELYYAETLRPRPNLYVSYRELACEHETIPMSRLPLGLHGIFGADVPYHWTLGWDLTHQVDVAVPVAAIMMAPGDQAPHETGVFGTSSNGLASGNTLLEAVNAALLEVIERDAVSCRLHAWRTGRDEGPRLISPESLGDLPLVAQLIERLDRAAVALAVADCTTDTGVPVYMAWVWNRDGRGFGVYAGYGAHLDSEIAVVRAVTEAIQSRAVFIAGSRDNIFRHEYRRSQLTDNERQVALLDSLSGSLDIEHARSFAEPSFEGDTGRLLDALEAVGACQVIVLPLSGDEFFGSVVKVMVPGFEGPPLPNYAPGARAMRFKG